MTIISTAVGAICLVYYLIIICYAGITADFAWFWLLAALGAFAVSGLSWYLKFHPGILPFWLGKAALGLLVLGLLYFGYLCMCIFSDMHSQGSTGLDYVVVLGAQVRGQKPSKALTKRLEKALDYARENTGTKLILTGGQGSGEEISEAECMSRWLQERGIENFRLILEDQSTSTKENLVNADRLTGCAEAHTGILSNDFHVYRGVQMARKLGYRQPEGIAADSDPIMEVHYIVREAFALVKAKLRGNI